MDEKSSIRIIAKIMSDTRKAKDEVEISNMKSKEIRGYTTRKEMYYTNIIESERAMAWLREGG